MHTFNRPRTYLLYLIVPYNRQTQSRGNDLSRLASTSEGAGNQYIGLDFSCSQAIAQMLRLSDSPGSESIIAYDAIDGSFMIGMAYQIEVGHDLLYFLSVYVALFCYIHICRRMRQGSSSSPKYTSNI